NEHILGDRWPGAAERLEMLAEAVEVIRLLWRGGVQSHTGRHYRVEHCRVYDLPPTPPKIIVSGFGPRAVALAAEIGDGYCTVGPDADSVAQFRAGNGNRTGNAGNANDNANDNDDRKLVQGGLKVCFGDDERQAREQVHRLWPTEALPGELSQVLPTPAHFEQASQLVTVDAASAGVPCGPDLDEHLGAIRAYADAGFDELYVNQIGPEQDAFFAAYGEQILPHFR
ncbi:MAG: TIGR03557 family F420-dependent LLM class oxidoreductase, partial [Solirubrobacteraceae bacterium]